MKIKRRSLLVVGFLLSVFLMAATASAQIKWNGTVVKEGDVTIVKNPKDPLYKTPVLELTEELSLGGPDAQGEYALDRARSFIVDDAGTIYVLELLAAHIKVFDAAGKYVRTISRKGQGPGELEYPMTLSFNRTKGELAVQQQSRGIVFFKTDGTFLRHLTLSGTLGGRARLDSQGQIYILDIVTAGSESKYATKKLAPDGSLLATISETPTPTGPGNTTRAFIPVAYFQIDRDDRFVYGYPQTYEIHFYGPAEAKAVRKITRQYDPVAVTEEDKAERKKGVPPGYNREFDFPKYYPAYSRFFMSDGAHLFVQTYEKADGGRFIHDIFDIEGRFIGRIPLKPSGVEILKGKYYALEEDEDGYQYVRRYAVTWKVK
jgi:hypothetical protein